ncbi:HAD-superfamily hydrolase, subfamily IA, variant 1 [Haloterrigena turkmenica DSM 5511]|uniref:HAD-superfamily hydrolase, subfamily IA, variant 1 n=1 Tax=Haloterrigena turkmenica (strain ATCC 51198 / DSM 5511 / JCM 9101 / NCIMB 13204 / VKM B-1734 / 4k) TaxID=543526 RepID=D2RT02_HALTV|nr:HAD family hydrolase [Haloterrigena turkmenica]ADB60882.1 HAD-superfamily hydrolase, subfamily IA, variant 1 [Haloterrigena turkmenica DSM 5511]
MQYDAVLFDFDGVVVENPSPRRMYDALARTYEQLGRSDPAAETVQEILSGDFESIADRCRRLEVDTDTFCSQAASEMIRTQLADVERGLRSMYDDVAAVRSLEAPLGVVSDNHPTVVSRLLDRFGLRSLFETVYGCPLTPDGLARRKPDPTNIERAMDSLEAESALYVGDRPVDVQAAHNAGIDSALVARADDEMEMGTAESPDAAPTYRLASLTQLPAALE